MSYIHQIAEEAATGPIATIYRQSRKRAGGVANIVKVMSLDGSVCEASMNLYVTSMRTDNVLERATREMLATVVSNVNDCYY